MDELKTIFEKHLSKDKIILLSDLEIYRVFKRDLPDNSQIVADLKWVKCRAHGNYEYPSYIIISSLVENIDQYNYEELLEKLKNSFLEEFDNFFKKNKIIRLAIRYLPRYRELQWHEINNNKIIDKAVIETCIFPIREGGQEFENIYFDDDFVKVNNRLFVDEEDAKQIIRLANIAYGEGLGPDLKSGFIVRMLERYPDMKKDANWLMFED